MLRTSVAPAKASAATRAEAERIVTALLERLDYVGVIGVELFELGRRLAEGQRVRAAGPQLGPLDPRRLRGRPVRAAYPGGGRLALGPTEPLAAVEMTNLLGPEAHDWAALAADPSARIWLYGKREDTPSKAGSRRKMGHVNRLSPLPGR